MKHRKKLVPYKTILAAKNGDTFAMNEILVHYDSYINYYSRRDLCDAAGKPYTYFDEEIKARIQEKLLCKVISDFDPAKLPKDNEEK